MENILEEIKTLPILLVAVILLIVYVHKNFVTKDKMKDGLKLFQKDITIILEKLNEIKDDLKTIKGV